MVMLAVKEETPNAVRKNGHDLWSGEVMAFCPQCKAFQTVWIDGDTLTPTRKFVQEGGQIYHDCGSNQPCRLYHSW